MKKTRRLACTGSLRSRRRASGVHKTLTHQDAHPRPHQQQEHAPTRVEDAFTEYENDTYTRHKELEVTYAVHTPLSIDCSTRAGLFDWMGEAHKQLQMEPSTLFLSYNILDRYCALATVEARALRLVGAAALVIAGKYEEIDPPSMRSYVNVCLQSYDKHEIITMESRILECLEYRVTVPTVYTFMAFASRAVGGGSSQLASAMWLARCVMRSAATLAYKPSVLAAAIVYLTRAQVVGYTQAQCQVHASMCAVSHADLVSAANHIIDCVGKSVGVMRKAEHPAPAATEAPVVVVTGTPLIAVQ
jgi:hypothetical protein